MSSELSAGATCNIIAKVLGHGCTIPEENEVPPDLVGWHRASALAAEEYNLMRGTMIPARPWAVAGRGVHDNLTPWVSLFHRSSSGRLTIEADDSGPGAWTVEVRAWTRYEEKLAQEHPGLDTDDNEYEGVMIGRFAVVGGQLGPVEVLRPELVADRPDRLELLYELHAALGGDPWPILRNKAQVAIAALRRALVDEYGWAPEKVATACGSSAHRALTVTEDEVRFVADGDCVVVCRNGEWWDWERECECAPLDPWCWLFGATEEERRESIAAADLGLRGEALGGLVAAAQTM